MKQTSFSFMKDDRKEFGGSLLVGKRKERRPLSTKHPIHLILKSCEKGVFAPTNRSLQKLIVETAKRFDIKIYESAINWSHVHLVIRIYRREDYCKFIRVLTSILSQKVKRVKGIKRVFALRPYTRILSWGRDFKNALYYQILNQMEAMEFNVKSKSKKTRRMRSPRRDRPTAF